MEYRIKQVWMFFRIFVIYGLYKLKKNRFDFSVSEANCKKVKEVAESVNEELKELVKSLKKEGYIHLIEGLKNNIEAMETGNKK